MVALVPVYDTTMGRVIHIATIVVTNLTTSVTPEMMHQLEVPIAEHVTIIVQGDSEIGAVTFLIIEIHVTLTSEMNVSSRRCGENEVVQEARIEIGTEKEINTTRRPTARKDGIEIVTVNIRGGMVLLLVPVLGLEVAEVAI